MPAADGLLERGLAYLSPRWALKRAAAKQMLAYATGYKGADITTLRPDWITFGDSVQTPPAHELSILRERSRDANRNHPVAAGASDTFGQNIVGSGLKPQSRIRPQMIGIPPDHALALQMQAESAFERFKPLAGADNRLDFDELQFLALIKIIEDGETLIMPTWANDPWRPFGRCLQIIESERLAQPGAPPKNTTNGITFGPRQQPVTYHILKAGQAVDFVKIAAHDDKGRPKILHIFRTRRPGQQRGIPLFAPVLTYFKDLADYLEAEIVAARVAACLAVFITRADQYGPLGTESPQDETIQELSPGMLAKLRPGEGINVVEPKRPGDTFDAFIESILRLIGMSVGLPYELLAKDFSKTNYSSARASMLEGRRMFKNWRNWFAAKFCQPIWDMVIEEAYLRGQFDAPDFYKYRAEYCRANWIGGGWGWVDPTKEVEASRMAIDYGLSTLAKEAAAQGDDWEENIDQLTREKQRIDAAEVDIHHSAKVLKEDAPDGNTQAK
jgi:lambda family phage portal protein